MSWQPKCDHFSYMKDINDKTHHFCSLEGEPTEIHRSWECRRCPHNPDIIWPDGYIQFRHTTEGIQYCTYEYDDFMKEMKCREPIGDIMTGKQFFDMVDCGCIINYDGSIGCIWLDNALTNLGLAHEGLSQGEFLVDGETWLEICENFDVKVEWCNK